MLKYQRIITPSERSFFLFGPRGTGKSSWLREQFATATYIDLLGEGRYQSLLANPGLFGSMLESLPNNSSVIVDEIQRLPNLLNEVHRFIEKKKLHFILSGSSARKLKKEGVNLLAGRAIRKELFPFVREELGSDFQLERILEHGSLPILWMSGGEREVMEAYIQTYLKEEIQAEALVRNLPGFARFLPVAALFNAQVLNYSSLGRDAGVERTTVQGYIEILEDTLLGYRLFPYEGRLRVKEKKHPKLYWVDPGVVRAVKKQFGPVAQEERGALFESWIASTLRAYKSYSHLFDDWYYWCPTETQSLEVDFLLVKGNECVAIEVKSSLNFRTEFTRGLQALSEGLKDLKLTRRIVVYCGKDALQTKDGVEVLPCADFLSLVESNRLFR